MKDQETLERFALELSRKYARISELDAEIAQLKEGEHRNCVHRHELAALTKQLDEMILAAGNYDKQAREWEAKANEFCQDAATREMENYKLLAEIAALRKELKIKGEIK